MINQGNNVPDKTIAVFVNKKYKKNLKKDQLFKLITKSPKKRDWFTPHFYRCLPLTIGNTYGFIIKSEFSFSAIWNGGPEPSDTTLKFEKETLLLENKFPKISTHFGSGIITIDPPFFLRTPPGVNLMTINPPNYVIPNITVLTGVVETDNLRRNFTFNIKLQIPNVEVIFPSGTPLSAFVPVPRYFLDSFELTLANEIFSKELIDEELIAEEHAFEKRKIIDVLTKNKVGRDYFRGVDSYGNVFPDHQKP